MCTLAFSGAAVRAETAGVSVELEPDGPGKPALALVETKNVLGARPGGRFLELFSLRWGCGSEHFDSGVVTGSRGYAAVTR